MLRRIIAIILGVVGGGIVVSLIQRISTNKYPMPEGLNLADKQAYYDFVLSLPKEAFFIILASHFAGGFIASIIASALSTSLKKQMGFIAGFVMLIFTLMTLAMIPHPAWMYVSDPITVIAAVILGAFVGSKIGKS